MTTFHHPVPLVVCLALLGICDGIAQAPGIPEPPLILFGTVTEAQTSQPVVISTVAWQVNDGTANKTFSAASLPATRIISSTGESFYMLQVPYDTRIVQSGSGQITLTAATNSFELKTASPAYSLTATINGQAAKIKAVNGAAQPANTTAYTFNDYTPATQGRMIRVDLQVATDSYITWATGFFGSSTTPNALRAADPDGDGMTNEEEFNAGTNPTLATSALRVTNVSGPVNGTSFTITWKSVAGKKYQIEASLNLESASWTPIGGIITATGATASTTVATTPGVVPNFFRVHQVP